MGRSRADWDDIAWHERAREYGKRTYKRGVYWRYAPVAALVVGLGGTGYGCWWVYDHAHRLLTGGHVHGPAVPIWLWLAGALLLVVTMIAFRPGRLPTPKGPRALKLAALAVAWLFVIGVMISFA